MDSLGSEQKRLGATSSKRPRVDNIRTELELINNGINRIQDKLLLMLMNCRAVFNDHDKLFPV